MYFSNTMLTSVMPPPLYRHLMVFYIFFKHAVGEKAGSDSSWNLKGIF